MPSPQISVVIPCHNAARWLGETLASVAAQREVAFEIVVVDDGSTDDSAAIAEQAAKSLPMTILRQPQRGASAARAAGTAAATAPFIQYLDSDDLLMPGTLQRRLHALNDCGADVAYCDFVHYEPGPDNTFGDTIVRERMLGDRAELELLTDAWWPPGALLYRRAVVEGLKWREDLPVIQDARFLLDASLAGATFVRIPGVGLRYRIHGNGSLSRRNPTAFLEDCYRSIDEIDTQWTHSAAIDDARRKALAKCYAFLTRAFFPLNRQLHDQALKRLLALEPGYLPEGPADFRMLTRIVGFSRAEQIAEWCRPLKHALPRLLGRAG